MTVPAQWKGSGFVGRNREFASAVPPEPAVWGLEGRKGVATGPTFAICFGLGAETFKRKRAVRLINNMFLYTLLEY